MKFKNKKFYFSIAYFITLVMLALFFIWRSNEQWKLMPNTITNSIKSIDSTKKLFPILHKCKILKSNLKNPCYIITSLHILMTCTSLVKFTLETEFTDKQPLHKQFKEFLFLIYRTKEQTIYLDNLFNQYLKIINDNSNEENLSLTNKKTIYEGGKQYDLSFFLRDFINQIRKEEELMNLPQKNQKYFDNYLFIYTKQFNVSTEITLTHYIDLYLKKYNKKIVDLLNYRKTLILRRHLFSKAHLTDIPYRMKIEGVNFILRSCAIYISYAPPDKRGTDGHVYPIILLDEESMFIPEDVNMKSKNFDEYKRLMKEEASIILYEIED